MGFRFNFLSRAASLASRRLPVVAWPSPPSAFFPFAAGEASGRFGFRTPASTGALANFFGAPASAAGARLATIRTDSGMMNFLSFLQ